MAAPIHIEVTPSSIAQGDFWDSPALHRVYLAGIGAGKTLAGAVALLQELLADPRALGLVAAPTYKMLRDAAQRTFFRLFQPLITNHNATDNHTKLLNGAEILWRSTDNPDSLRGINASCAWLDEGAYCDPDAWNVILGRLREGSGRAWITTTPKGKGWLHELYQRGGAHFIRAKTSDNTALPAAYVATLHAAYKDRFAAQELDGEFVDWSGGLFRSEWFPRLYIPATALPPRLRWVRAWDVAFSAKSSADETAGVRAALDRTTNTLYLASPLAARLEAPDAREMIIQTALADGREIPVHVEAVASQVATIQDLTRDPRLLAHRVHPIRPQGDKVASAVPFASRAAAGTVRLVGSPAEWAGWVEQWLAFPSGTHDDRVDAVSRAIEALADDPTAWLAPLQRQR